MIIKQVFLTNNDCYKSGKKLHVKGIMVHSTGANNPNLCRYISPDDGFLGENKNNNSWNRPKPDNRQVCVHAFIGKRKDGTVATYQTLPWEICGWHAGSGSKGSANDTHIGFEICEDGLNDNAYFAKIYQEAVELCAYLCQKYALSANDVICHSEGHTKGIASNHSDVMHWFSKFNKNMNGFREEVNNSLKSKPNINKNNNTQYYKVQVGAFRSKSNANNLFSQLQEANYAPCMILVEGLWKIQLGAFASQQNAEKLKNELLQKGYEAYVIYQ